MEFLHVIKMDLSDHLYYVFVHAYLFCSSCFVCRVFFKFKCSLISDVLYIWISSCLSSQAKYRTIFSLATSKNLTALRANMLSKQCSELHRLEYLTESDRNIFFSLGKVREDHFKIKRTFIFSSLRNRLLVQLQHCIPDNLLLTRIYVFVGSIWSQNQVKKQDT